MEPGSSQMGDVGGPVLQLGTDKICNLIEVPIPSACDSCGSSCESECATQPISLDKKEESSDSGDIIEYEVAHLSPDTPNPFFSTDTSDEEHEIAEIAQLGAVAAAVCYDRNLLFEAEEEIWADKSVEVSTSPTSNSDVDPELPRQDYFDFVYCAQCKAHNYNRYVPFCDKCYKIRKNFFPARPPPFRKRRRLVKYDSGVSLTSKRSMSLLSHPSSFETGTTLGLELVSGASSALEPGNGICPKPSISAVRESFEKPDSKRNRISDEEGNSIGFQSQSKRAKLDKNTFGEITGQANTELCASGIEKSFLATVLQSRDGIVVRTRPVSPKLSNNSNVNSTVSQPISIVNSESFTSEHMKNAKVPELPESQTSVLDYDDHSQPSTIINDESFTSEHNKSAKVTKLPETQMSVHNDDNDSVSQSNTQNLTQHSGIIYIESSQDADVVDGPSRHRNIGPLCDICLERPKNGLFAHGYTAHLYSCYQCAKIIWRQSGRCPLCRMKIDKVIKVLL